MNSTAPPIRDLESPVEVHLRDYVRIVMKRKWAVVGLFVSVVTGAALHVLEALLDRGLQVTQLLHWPDADRALRAPHRRDGLRASCGEQAAPS